MTEIPVRWLGGLGFLGVVGIVTGQPALFASFALFASGRTIDVPTPGNG